MKNIKEISEKKILNSIALFGSANFLQIILSVVREKLLLLFYGFSGVATYSIINTFLTSIRSFFGLGIDQSIVRDLAAEKEINKKQLIISTSLVIGFLLGLISSTLVIFSPTLVTKILGISNFNFLEKTLIGVSVLFQIIFFIGQGVLQGLQENKKLALSIVLSNLFSLVLTLILYLFVSINIIPFLFLLNFLSSFVLVAILIKKALKKVNMVLKLGQWKEVRSTGTSIISLGLTLSAMSIIINFKQLYLKNFLISYDGDKLLALFSAGAIIVNRYFGLVLISIKKDYYPSLSRLSGNYEGMKDLAHKQIRITILLIAPLLILLNLFSSLIVNVLYDQSFAEITGFILLASLGILFQAYSQTLGLCLIAEKRYKVYLVNITVLQSIFLLTEITLLKYFGLIGLGMAFSLNYLTHLVVVSYLTNRLFNIGFDPAFKKIFYLIITLITCFIFCSKVEFKLSSLIKYLISFSIFAISIKELMGDLFKKQKNEINT